MVSVFGIVPFARVLLPLVVGIILSWHFDFAIINKVYFIYLAFIYLVALFLAYHFKLLRQLFLVRYLFGASSFFICLLLGNFLAEHKKLENQELHFSQYQAQLLACVVKQKPKIGDNSLQISSEVFAVKEHGVWEDVEGKILLYLAKTDTNVFKINYGDTLIGRFQFQEIAGKRNPGEFDFKNFMALSGKFHQAYLQSLDAFVHLPKREYTSFDDYIFLFQQGIRDLLDNHIQNQDSRAILTALTMGNKDLLSDEISSAYSKAGAMHVLAVSGLHVGIIFILIMRILAPLNHTVKGRIAIAVLQILFIWIFAFIAGFGPSVRRAATMFTVIAIGSAKSRQPNVYNSLVLSAFVILLLDPLLIFHVGFQLSYAAVLGIVYFQPKLNGLWKFPPKYLKWAWDLICVSIAAQLATVLITLFYFHQFPLYFVFSNLIIIPAITLILQTAVAFLFFGSLWQAAAEWLGYGLDAFIVFLNEIVLKIELLPYNIIDQLWISRNEMFIMFGVAIIAIVWVEYRRRIYFKYLLFSLLFFALFAVQKRMGNYNSLQFTIYDIHGADVIEFRNGKEAVIFSNLCNENDFNALSFSVYPESWIGFYHLPELVPIDTAYFEHLSVKKVNGFMCFQNRIYTFLNQEIDTIPDDYQVIITDKFVFENYQLLKNAKKIILSGSVNNYLRQRITNDFGNKTYDVKTKGYFRDYFPKTSSNWNFWSRITPLSDFFTVHKSE